MSAMSPFARSTLLCGCVFFALFKRHGVPPPGAAFESLHNMQRNVLTAERYLDDWGDQLFQYTFAGLSLPHRLEFVLHPSALRGQQQSIQQLHCPNGLVLQRRNTRTVPCRGDGNCGWHSLLNGNCTFLGQVCTRHCLYATHSAWSQLCLYVQRRAHRSRRVCRVRTCVAQQYSRVFAFVAYPYVFEPAIVYYLTFHQRSCGANAFRHLCIHHLLCM